jgi:hypothetical protein
LNEQFKSVFTKEDLDNFPQIDDSGTPDIPNLNIICLNMTWSMILQGTDVNDTGRLFTGWLLSPFLNSAVTFATSQSFGTLCSSMD